MYDDPQLDGEQAGTEMTGGMNLTIPHSARVWSYWLRGKDYYQPDQEAADKFAAAFPGIEESVRQLRCFTARVVRHLAGQGVRQFLDIGVGLPDFLGNPVHEVALAAAPGCRVAYADNDALVMAHARALLKGPPGTVTHVHDTLDDPGALLAAARDHGRLDFTRPVAILVMSTLGHIGDPGQDDDQTARAVTATLKAALPPGGYLAIGDLAAHPDLNNALDAYNASGAAPYRARTTAQLARLFEGLELTEPGAGPAAAWRPDPDRPTAGATPAWGAVGRRP